jgi:hypothetical protein
MKPRRIRRQGRARAAILISVALVVGAAGLTSIWIHRFSGPGLRRDGPVDTAAAGPPAPPASFEEGLRAFCSRCHLFPPPDSTVKRKWEKEVRSMVEIAGADAAPGLSIARAIEYFRERAPEELPWPQSHAGRGLVASPAPRVLHVTPVGAPPTPAISSLRLAKLFDDAPPVAIGCDMRHGLVFVQRRVGDRIAFDRIAEVPHPARTAIADLDADGRRDLLVADLGSFNPGDHDRGRALWLRALDGRRFETVPLLEGIGRVSDVQAGDLDGDGDLDLAVASFGWRATGEVIILENLGGRDGSGRPRFNRRQLDPRPGALQSIIEDLDRDGRLDVVVQFAQHFETVCAFLNRGALVFEAREIHRAPHPNWGYSSMELADLDADGDLDAVAVNGDALDDGIPKPFHGVAWLENVGSFPFRERWLATLPGAHQARVVDLDGDGDLDVVACAFLPHFPMETRRPLTTDSVLLIEQIGRGEFAARALEALASDHVALDAGDFDGDGRLEVMTGSFVLDPKQQAPISDWITIIDP